MRCLRALALVMVAVLWADRVAAQGAPANTKADAMRLTQDATKQFNLANYPKAIELYKAAYELVPDPTLLFNIAQSHRLAGEFRLARTFYKNYLNNAPNANNVAQVEQKIAEMEKAIAEQDKAQASPPTGPITTDHDDAQADIPSPDKVAGMTETPAPAAPEPTESRKPIYKKWWFWAGIGAVAVGVVAVVAVASSGGDPSPPTSDYGNTNLFLSGAGR